MRTPTYRYLLADLLTDRTLAVLPLSGVSFERRISRVGEFKATFEPTTPDQVRMARVLHAGAGRTALWVFRNGQLWWGGIPWTVNASMDDRSGLKLDVQAATFDSYAHHRQLRTDLVFEQIDQGAIVAGLWRHLQTDPRGNIGMVAEDQPTGMVRDRTYLGSELSYYGQLIEDLGDVEDGPEHTVDVYLDAAGNRVKRLRVADKLGDNPPSLVLSRAAKGGGRITSWGDLSDAVDSGTAFQVRGAVPDNELAEDQPPLMSPVLEADDLLDAGWPLLDKSEDRTDVTEQGTLNGYAQALRASYAGNVIGKAYTVDLQGLDWTPNQLGEPVRLKLADLWHDPPVDTLVRPVAVSVTAAERGTPESVALVFGED